MERYLPIGGEVYIDIRSGHDEAVIHENRHGNQILGGTDSKPVLAKETEAFINKFIDIVASNKRSTPLEIISFSTFRQRIDLL